MYINAEKAGKYLEEKWGAATCPMCKCDKLVLSLPVYEINEYGVPAEAHRTAVMPLIAVMCDNCGLVLHVNAIAAGIVNEEK